MFNIVNCDICLATEDECNRCTRKKKEVKRKKEATWRYREKEEEEETLPNYSLM